MKIRDNFGNLTQNRQVKCLKMEYQYTWIIPNFRDCFCSVGNHDESPTFSTGQNDEYEWKLIIYLGGYSTHSNYTGHISISPVLLNKASHDNGKFIIEMSLLNKDGQEQGTQSKILTVQNLNTITGMFTCSVSKQDLLRDPNLLPDGELRISCQISFDVPNTTTEELIDAQYFPFYKSHLDNFEQLFHKGQFSDFKLIIGTNEIPVHQAILAPRSPVFEAMFLSNMRESTERKAHIEDVDPEIMMQVLRYIYVGKIGKIEDIAVKVLVVADKYQLDALKQICEDVLVEQLTIDNIYKILELADSYNGENLKKRTIDFFKKNSETLSAADGFRATISSLSGNLQTDIICASVEKK